MEVFAGICFVVSAAAELGGIGLLVQQARAARRQLDGWEAANPEDNPKGSYAQTLLLNPVVTRLLREQSQPRTAVLLLGSGVIAGMIGNFASL